MLTVPRDHPEYPWHHRPADHSVAGLFVDGPQEAGGVLARLMSPTHCREQAPSPTVALAQQRIQRTRARTRASGIAKLLRQLQGVKTRNRKAA